MRATHFYLRLGREMSGCLRLGADPQGASSGAYRVIHGGCWGYKAFYCRAAGRSDFALDFHSDAIGFRLVWSPMAR